MSVQEALDLWHTAVEARGVALPPTSLFSRATWTDMWCFSSSKTALGLHAKLRWQEEAADLQAAAPQILNVLESSISTATSGGLDESCFDMDAIDVKLGSRLRDMLYQLKNSNFSIAWKVDEVTSTQIRSGKVFMGTVRSEGMLEKVVWQSSGLLFTMPPDRWQLFQEKKIKRRDVYEKTLASPFTNRIILMLSTKQRSICTERAGKFAAVLGPEAEVQEVKHQLLLERELHAEEAGDLVSYKPRSWVLVDWNNICDGNLPFTKVDTS